MKNKTNFKRSNAPVLFTTTDKRILALSASQNKEEVFKNINSNKHIVNRQWFKNRSVNALKKARSQFKKSNTEVLQLTSSVIKGSPLENARFLQNLKY